MAVLGVLGDPLAMLLLDLMDDEQQVREVIGLQPRGLVALATYLDARRAVALQAHQQLHA